MHKRLTLWAILFFVVTCVLAVASASPLFATSPSLPTVVAPVNGAINVVNPTTLSVTVSDPDNDYLTVAFYGRVAATTVPTFTIVALPDTQFYSASYPDVFTSQTQWIVDNRNAWNIVYVAHEGDIVDSATSTMQWIRANTSMSLLDNANIPYGVLPGNHDTPTTNYNNYFGVSRFSGKSSYGGYYGSNNDNNYALFTAGGMDFIIINLQYNPATEVLDWANGLLQTYSSRRAIVVTHNLLNTSGTWSNTNIYPALYTNSNLFLMLCGHNHGEARRADTYNENTVNSLLADYQSLTPYGGNGYLRLMEFAPNDNVIRVKTYSPYLSAWDTDTGSQFTLTYTMTTPSPFQVIGTNTNVPSGSTTSVSWPGRSILTQYEWYVTVSDGTTTTTGTVSRFTTDSVTAVTRSSFKAAASVSNATVWIVIGLGGVLVIGTGAFAVRKRRRQ